MKNTNQHKNSIFSIESDRLFGQNSSNFTDVGMFFKEIINCFLSKNIQNIPKRHFHKVSFFVLKPIENEINEK